MSVSCSNLCYDAQEDDGDDDRRHCHTMLVLGSRPEQVLRSKLVLVQVLDSKRVLEQVQGSRPAWGLGSIPAWELGSILVLVLGCSKLVLAHHSHCHDGDDDQLELLEQTLQRLPIQPELESQTSWSILLNRGTTCGRTCKYTNSLCSVNGEVGVVWVAWLKFSVARIAMIAFGFLSARSGPSKSMANGFAPLFETQSCRGAERGAVAPCSTLRIK